MIEGQIERILCAANWYPDLVWPHPYKGKDELPKMYWLPLNCDRGVVFFGHRHLQCMWQMIQVFGLRQCEAGEEMDGFLTSTNRWVGREEAAKIALAAGQIDHLNYQKETLYSEDLY